MTLVAVDVVHVLSLEIFAASGKGERHRVIQRRAAPGLPLISLGGMLNFLYISVPSLCVTRLVPFAQHLS